MTNALVDQIYQNMQGRKTEELLAIWTTNDKDHWSESAFEAIQKTLTDRGIAVPLQCAVIASAPRYEGVHGWLLFFCIVLTILNPLMTMAEFGATIKVEDGHTQVGRLLVLAMAAYSTYVGICLWRVLPSAVVKAKVFLWFNLAIAVVGITAFLFMTGFSSKETTIAGLARSLAFCLFWLSYLSSSERVKATYVT